PQEAAALVDGDYEYELTGDPAVAVLTAYTGAGGAISIPSTLGGYSTAIISYEAFNRAAGYHVTSVLIPNSVHTIQNYAFANCDQLVTVYIGSGVSSIGDAVFYNCYNLGEISVHAGNPYYTSVGGVLYDDAFSTLVKCPPALDGDVSIPDSVTSLRDGCFDDCRYIDNLVIGSGVSEIGDYMLDEVDHLKTVTFSTDSQLESIGDRAFAICEELVTFYVPAGLKTIGQSAFQGCDSLLAFDLPEGLEVIGSGAFAGCTSLVNLTIPASVEEIGPYAFGQCNSLEWFDVDPDSDYFRSIDGVLYNKTATVLMQCPGGKTGNLTIPDSVIEIPMLSVAGCKITGVVIGNGVETIGTMSFFMCTKLKTVEMGDSVEIIGAAAFSGCKLIQSIEVPATVTEIQAQAFAECLTLNNITFLGSSAQIKVGSDWILHTSSELQGHAPAGSDFPGTGTTYYGLLMGTNVGEVSQEKDMTETYLLLGIVLLAALIVMLAVVLVFILKRKV
ncbi:MAG TPA: leucine-rich repeat protein, partial [Methanomassiliicoccales archaeon]|nr:leucine-rich repeat protein [Methanomassiliicoccales archaeon]